MRHYFKEKENKKNRLYKFAEENGADYIEDGMAVWKKPKKSKGGDKIPAICLYENGKIEFGHINSSCDNFECDTNYIVPETQKWIIEILQIIQKYHK